ncbi:hypothetical protein GCM10022393_24820 [Aquimarina addita]|uniref:HTH luxR-type domain-containing protein n=1 Tax=Aquimarina addita TaxID=870485 RepID=A0ABP6UNC5_9FLAO
MPGISQITIDSSVYSKKYNTPGLHKNVNDSLYYQKELTSLKEAITFSDLKKEFRGYQSLAKYHSQINHKNIDSVIYYFDRLESKIAELTKDGTLDAIYKTVTLNHYLEKGAILSTNFGLLEEGLQSYYKAYPFIEKDDINFGTVFDVLRAQNHRQQKHYGKAIQILKPRIQDTTSLDLQQRLLLLKETAKCYQLYNRPRQSYQLHKDIITISEKNKDTSYLVHAKNEISYDLFLLNNIKEAILMATTLRELYLQQSNNKTALFTNSKYLGKFYQKTGDIDTAIIYYKDALTYTIETKQFPHVYDQLIACHKAKGNYTIIADLYEEKEKTKDTLALNDLNQHIAYKKITNKLRDQKTHNIAIQDENSILKAEAKARKLYILFLSLILGLLLTSLLVYKKYYSQKNEVKNLKKNEERLLRETITLRENQLEVSQLKIEERKTMMIDLKDEIKDLNTTHPLDLDPIATKIDHLLDSADCSLSDSEKINDKDINFKLRLEILYPQLSRIEIRYCLLTKMGKSIRETADFLNVSENTVKTARTRIKKKMKLAPSLTLKTYLKYHF